MIAVMCCGGELSRREIFERYYEQSDYAIALDSGIQYFYLYEKKCEYILGDFDSIDKRGIDFIKIRNIPVKKYPAEKDYTDFEIGVRFLVKLGYQTIYIFGATGNRVDQMLSSLHFISKFKQHIIVVDNNNRIQYIQKSKTITNEFKYISIIPMSSDGIELTLKGFRYPLQRAFVPFASTLTSGNYLLEEQGKIEVLKGKALLIETN